MRVGQARKRDANEKAIVEALQAIGVLVYRVSAPGLPDLLTWDARQRAGQYWLPIEVKRHRAWRSLSDTKGRSLTPAQCVTYGLTHYPIVDTVTEALALFGVLSPDRQLPARVVDAIRDRGKAGEPVAETAEDFGVSRSVVRRLQAGKGRHG